LADVGTSRIRPGRKNRVLRQDRLDREAVELEQLASASGDGPELARRSSRGTRIPCRERRAHDRRAGSRGDRWCVGDVVEVAVADEDRLCPGDIHAFRRSSGVTPTAYRERHMLRMP